MARVSIVEAKAHLSELIDRAIGGEEIEITRRGEPVAHLSAVARPKKPIDVAMLRALTDKMAPQPTSAGDLIRQMRDEDRY